jgi:hypothetical protein
MIYDTGPFCTFVNKRSSLPTKDPDIPMTDCFLYGRHPGEDRDLAKERPSFYCGILK